jgi:hypothetical protein
MSYENGKKYDAQNPKPSTNLLEQSRNLWLQAVRGEVGECAAKKWYSDLMKGLYLGEVPETLQKVLSCCETANLTCWFLLLHAMHAGTALLFLVTSLGFWILIACP